MTVGFDHFSVNLTFFSIKFGLFMFLHFCNYYDSILTFLSHMSQF